MTILNLVGCMVFPRSNELSHCLQGIPDNPKNSGLFDPGSDPIIIEKKSFPPFVVCCQERVYKQRQTVVQPFMYIHEVLTCFNVFFCTKPTLSGKTHKKVRSKLESGGFLLIFGPVVTVT